MGRVIAVTNQKGGVGKTTTSMQLGSGLADLGSKVLFIDMDPQCNLTYILRGKPDDYTILDILSGDVRAEDAIVHGEKVDFISSSPYISSMDKYIRDQGKEYALKRAISDIVDSYEYIIIDSPPTLGLTTVNVLTASDDVIIPAQADIFSLQGIGQLYGSIQAVQQHSNPDLRIVGILLTRQNERLIHSRELREMIEDAAETMGTKVFRASIRESVIIREATTSCRSIFSYAPKSRQAKDFKDFLDEYTETINSLK